MGENQVQFMIRPYVLSDFVRLCEIDRICFPPSMAYSQAELRYYLAGKRAIGLVAEISLGIAGFTVGRTEGRGLAHVITLDVLPEARRRGIGTALMDALHRELDRLGTKAVVLEVSTENSGAQRFYERLGYQTANLLRGYYSGTGDAWLMIRRTPAGQDRPRA
jgi:ribosomal-protein-alanine N-acetyltransferase